MNCPIQNSESSEILLDFCAGKLSAAAAAEFQDHVEACPDCRAFSEAQRQVWTDLDTWEAPPVSADFDRRLYERIAEADRSPSWRRWLAGRLMWRPALGAATACAALAIAIFVHDPGSPSASNETIEPEQVERALEDLEMLDQLSTSNTQDL